MKISWTPELNGEIRDAVRECSGSEDNSDMSLIDSTYN